MKRTGIGRTGRRAGTSRMGGVAMDAAIGRAARGLVGMAGLARVAGVAAAIALGVVPGCDAGGSPAPVTDATTDEAGAYLGPPAVRADTVVEAPGANAGTYGDPGRAVNGVHGGGDSAGSADVFALGFAKDQDDVLVLRWSGRRVLDGPGADLVVAENAFRIGTSDAVFMDPAIVSVSRDGIAWVDFPHDYLAPDEAAYSADPKDWKGFAGVTPVRWNDDRGDVAPFDRDAAGGDAFDVEDLPHDGAEGDAVRAEGFRFLRIRTAATRINPDSGTTYPHDPSATGPDIDGVVARYLEPDT